MIVQEFRAAIEERGLILVAFNNEFFTAAQTVALLFEISKHATYEKIRPASCYLKNPGEHGRSCSLTVRPSYDYRRMPRNKIFLQKLRHRAIRNFFIENVFDLRIPSRHDIPNHRQVRHRLQVFFAKSFIPADAQ